MAAFNKNFVYDFPFNSTFFSNDSLGSNAENGFPIAGSSSKSNSSHFLPDYNPFKASKDGFGNGFNVYQPSFAPVGGHGTMQESQERFPISSIGKNSMNATFNFQDFASLNAGLTNQHSCMSTSSEPNFEMDGIDMRREGKDQKKSNKAKQPWTSEEDSLLIDLVDKHGDKEWSKISKMIKGRLGKQCRERWRNYLRPGVNLGPWTENEDQILIQAHAELGNQWVKISERLEGRTENSIKNHFNTILRSGQTTKNPNVKSGALKHYINSVINDAPSSSSSPSQQIQPQAQPEILDGNLPQEDEPFDFIENLEKYFDFDACQNYPENSGFDQGMPPGGGADVELEGDISSWFKE